MKTNIIRTAGLLLLTSGGLLAAQGDANPATPAVPQAAPVPTAPMPGAPVTATPATAAPDAGAAAPAADGSVLARLAAARKADDGGAAPSAPSATAAAASASPSATAPAPSGGPPNESEFVLIARRNIFDPTRRPFVQGQQRVVTPVRLPATQVFSFRSASEKVGMGYTAFFTGFGVPPSGEVAINDSINGYKVVKLTQHSVVLAEPNSTNLVTLKEEEGMSRYDAGAWNKTIVPTIYSAFVASAPADVQPDYSAQPIFQPQQFTTTFGGGYDPTADTGAIDFTGGAVGRRRGTRGGNGGGGGRGGGGFGGGNGGGFTQDVTPAAPAAPADPAVLARLAARRAAEEAQPK